MLSHSNQKLNDYKHFQGDCVVQHTISYWSTNNK